jgi:hypothetical protein
MMSDLTVQYILDSNDERIQLEIIQLNNYNNILLFKDLIKSNAYIQTNILKDFLYNEKRDHKFANYQQGHQSIHCKLITTDLFNEESLINAINDVEDFNLVHILLLIKTSPIISGKILINILKKMKQDESFYNVNIENAIKNHQKYRNEALLIMDLLDNNETKNK